MKHRAYLQLATVAAVAATVSLPGQVSAQGGCELKTMGSAMVVAVRDGRTLMLADGRELRLAGIEAGDDARTALQTLAAGHPVLLGRLGPERDRYGRLVAFAFVGDAQESVQQVLLEQGRARVSARVGGKACAGVLLRTERKARAAGRGLWADPNFAPLSAENHAGLQADRGRFALVEGKVLSVHESGATIYVNFGTRWTRDFSVTILKRLRRTFAAAGVEPKKLAGRRIRVRGWIEQRGGPIVAAEAPEQIELLDSE
ncbi:MAG: thermonuclease family protein [Pseudolabrys sp.]